MRTTLADLGAVSGDVHPEGLSKKASRCVQAFSARGVGRILIWAAILMAFGAIAATGQMNGQSPLSAGPSDGRTEQPYAIIPKAAISRSSSFVLAYGGESYLFNYDAGVVRAPFMHGVYRSLGLSLDSARFLYLKSNGRFPTFSLYCYDLTSGVEDKVTDDQVLYAAWSSTTLEAAYVSVDRQNVFHLRIFDAATARSTEIAHGPLDSEFLEWSPQGDQLLYRAVVPLPAVPGQDQQFRTTLYQYSLSARKTAVIPGGSYARFDGSELVVAGPRKVAKGFRELRNPAGEDISSFAVADGEVYATVIEGGEPLVKRWNQKSSSFELVERGDIYLGLENAVVTRRFLPGGVEYAYWPADSAVPQSTTFSAARQTATLATQTSMAGSNWKMPFQGSAYLVQGGAAFTAGVCDGRNCLYSSHAGVMNYALDWQQVPTDGQGNTHVLAIEDGTVAVTRDD